LQLPEKPYYNPRTLEEGPKVVKGKLILRPSQKRANEKSRVHGYLRISDVARIVGVSPSILRSWENLGLVAPTRTHSRYRIYTHADVRILKRAQFFPARAGHERTAIVHLLKTHKLLPHAGERPKAGPVGPPFTPFAIAEEGLALTGGARDGCFGWIPQRGRAAAK